MLQLDLGHSTKRSKVPSRADRGGLAWLKEPGSFAYVWWWKMTVDLFDWRKHLKVHPAVDLFPLLSETELKELAAEITQKGLRVVA